MINYAKISMRKFQAWTIGSFILLTLIVSPAVMMDNNENIRWVTIFGAIIMGIHAVYKSARIVGVSGDIDIEDVSDEEDAALKIVGFGVYLFFTAVLSSLTMLFNFILAYKFFFYQLIMGTAYFSQKHNVYMKYVLAKALSEKKREHRQSLQPEEEQEE